MALLSYVRAVLFFVALVTVGLAALTIRQVEDTEPTAIPIPSALPSGVATKEGGGNGGEPFASTNPSPCISPFPSREGDADIQINVSPSNLPQASKLEEPPAVSLTPRVTVSPSRTPTPTPSASETSSASATPTPEPSPGKDPLETETGSEDPDRTEIDTDMEDSKEQGNKGDDEKLPSKGDVEKEEAASSEKKDQDEASNKDDESSLPSATPEKKDEEGDDKEGKTIVIEYLASPTPPHSFLNSEDKDQDEKDKSSDKDDESASPSPEKKDDEEDDVEKKEKTSPSAS